VGVEKECRTRKDNARGKLRKHQVHYSGDFAKEPGTKKKRPGKHNANANNSPDEARVKQRSVNNYN